MKLVETTKARPEIPHIDKWEVFRQLCTARLALGVTDRDLTVLNALLSFYPEVTLSDNASLIVFPSNRVLAERAHGMAESTLRRHLAALVHAGLVLRHDSPNGKRYATRGRDGEVARAFGFDLRPLLVRAAEISQAARATEDAAERLRRLREQITLTKRDALKLALYGQAEGIQGDWDASLSTLMHIHKAMRRKLPPNDLETILRDVTRLLDDILGTVKTETEEMSGNADVIERQFQNSNTDYTDSELCLEKSKGQGTAPPNRHVSKSLPDRAVPKLPLSLVLKACPDIEPYSTHEVRHWHELIGVATTVRGMMGISPSAWEDAQRAMGPEVASIVICCILQKIGDIRSPGGYLRTLSTKAADGAFSPGPMVMALLNG